ncbi:ferredoxin [Gordonia sp. (in: high G+C Gram-positive bacteria)]|uniref:ferredoxin n=1 Tax=Gordonia sp. (in: high G+C Gram-positive bacteria) TaxID=84139 RepID=UPI003C723592
MAVEDEEPEPGTDRPELTVVADMSLCDGYGECVKAAPAVFALDDDGYVLIKDPNVSEEEEARVIRAVSRCPKGVLTLLADGKPVDIP